MACFAQIYAIAVLLVAQVSAAPCADCLNDDATSLLQANKVVTHGAKNLPLDASTIAEALQPEETAAEAPAIPAEPRAHETAELQHSSPGVSHVDEAVDDLLEPDRVAEDHMEDEEQAYRLGRSVLPPNVGHGDMDANRKVVLQRAMSATMPGDPDGSVVQAYDTSLDTARDTVEGRANSKFAREMGDHSEARIAEENLELKIANQNDGLEEAIRANHEDIAQTLTDKRNVEQDAINEVADAQGEYDRAAIVKKQTEDASLEGRQVGERIGEERAAEHRQNALNDMAMKHLEEEHEAMQEAEAEAREEGITDRQRAVHAREVASDEYLKHRAKEIVAAESNSDGNTAIVKNDIVGPQHIKEHVIQQSAARQADHLRSMAAHDAGDTEHAVADGAAEVAEDIEADAMTGED